MEDRRVNATDTPQLTNQATLPAPKKPHHRGRVIGIVLLSLIFIAVLTAGWFGFIPGLSSLMGATKARDLAVHYTAADFASYQQKTGVTFKDFATAPANPNKPGKKVVFADPTTVSQLSLTQAEITAAINQSGWLWMPLTNVQVRLSDNTVELSGNLNMNHIKDFVNFIGGVGYNQTDVDTAISWGSHFVNNAPVYIKAAAAVQNDQLSFTLQTVTVGRFTVPIDATNRALTAGATNAITRTDNLEVKSATFKNGSLLFSGTYPTTIYVKHT